MVEKNSDVVQIAIIGGGLVGTLAAIYLARKGHLVDIYEYRDDTRKTENTVTGRNINLVLSTRGQKALRGVGLEEAILKRAVPLNGEMFHDRNGKIKTAEYRKEDIIYSIKRKHLNEVLLNAAEKEKNIQTNFNHKLVSADFKNGKMEFLNPLTDEKYEKQSDYIIGCDGAYSAVRKQLLKKFRLEYTQSYAEHGYMELPVPKTINGKSTVPLNYFHIWPMAGRDGCMMVGLPNQELTWNFTAVLPWKELDAIKTSEDVLRIFKANFPDVVDAIGQESLCKHVLSLKPQSLIMTKCEPVNVCSNVLLMGDSAHAMLPFLIQGMNTALEDVTVFMEIVNKIGSNFEAVFEEFNRTRLKDTIVMSNIDKRKYLFMIQNFNSKNTSWRKNLNNILYKIFPNFWRPLFEAITFSNIPYSKCDEQSQWQNNLVNNVVNASYVVTGAAVLGMAGFVFFRGIIF